MNSFSFNVLLEPWIPALYLDGKFEERGILGCLEDAHQIREIRSPAPIIEFGLYRLLVAFVLDALITADRRPEDEFDLQDLMQAGRFDMQLMQGYIKECGDVFDLFHPERPFLQTKMGNEPLKPLAGMFPAVPSGTNVSIWHHEYEERLAVNCQEAARMLTTIAPFMIAGGSGLGRSINSDPPLYSLVVGDSLFETLILNMPLTLKRSLEGDVIAWRNSMPPGKAYSQISVLQAFTWRPRQIQLIPKSESSKIKVSLMRFTKGDTSEGNTSESNWRDPSVSYKFENKKTTAIRLCKNRPIWRDAGALMLLNDRSCFGGDKKIVFRRPDVLEQSLKLVKERDVLLINVYGMRADNAKVFEWIKSVFTVPYSLGCNTRLGAILFNELKQAEDAAFSLRASVKALYPREYEEKSKQPVKGKKKRNVMGALLARSERGYWQKLEPVFHELMAAFGRLEEEAADDPVLIVETAKDWRKSIRQIALDQFEAVAKDMDADSDALERLVHARTRLGRSLAKLVGEVVR